MARARPGVFLIGDLPLVAEFGTRCDQAGYQVSYRLNHAPGQATLPRTWKKAPAPSKSSAAAAELTLAGREVKKKNLQLLDRSLPADRIVVSSAVTVTVLEQSGWIRHPGRLAGIGAFPTLLSEGLIEVSAAISTGGAAVRQAADFFRTLGMEVAIVQDRVGMVMPRILSMLINEAYFALTESVASPGDIDTAMKLGTNYPSGPIEWSDRIGVGNVAAVLDSLHAELGEDRYRVAPALRQLAGSPRWWKG